MLLVSRELLEILKFRILSMLTVLTLRFQELTLLFTKVVKSSLPDNKKTSVFINKSLSNFTLILLQLPMKSKKWPRWSLVDLLPLSMV